MKKWAFILLVGLASCYTENKARQQFSKAAIAYPKLPADYCATTYPVKDSIIRDTLLTTDTLVTPGQDLTDTITINDTVRITVTKTLPAKIITNTVRIRDTIYQTNTAEVSACKIDNSRLTALLVSVTADRDKYKAKANKRGWMFWGLIFLVIGAIGTRIYLKSKSIIK